MFSIIEMYALLKLTFRSYNFKKINFISVHLLFNLNIFIIIIITRKNMWRWPGLKKKHVQFALKCWTR